MPPKTNKTENTFAPGMLLAQSVYAGMSDKGGQPRLDRQGNPTGDTLKSVVFNRIPDSRIVGDDGAPLLRNMGVFNAPAALFFPSANVDKAKQSAIQGEFVMHVGKTPSNGVLVVNISIASDAQMAVLAPFLTDTAPATPNVIGQGI